MCKYTCDMWTWHCIVQGFLQSGYGKWGAWDGKTCWGVLISHSPDRRGLLVSWAVSNVWLAGLCSIVCMLCVDDMICVHRVHISSPHCHAWSRSSWWAATRKPKKFRKYLLDVHIYYQSPCKNILVRSFFNVCILLLLAWHSHTNSMLHTSDIIHYNNTARALLILLYITLRWASDGEGVLDQFLLFVLVNGFSASCHWGARGSADVPWGRKTLWLRKLK